MNTKRMLLTLLVILIVIGASFAQSGKLKRAKMYMENLNYIGAIEEYNKILEKDDIAEAKINIAECYRKINDAENSEFWYGQVVRTAESEPIHKLYYGQALQRNGKCDLAREWFEKYVEEVPSDLRGQYLVKACDYEEELRVKNAGIYEVTHLDINSDLDDFSPTYYKEGIIFASERDKGSAVKRIHCWTGNPFLELHYVDAKPVGEECGNYEYGRPEKFAKELNSKYHDAAVSFSNDKDQIFFTRNNYKDGKTGKSDDNIVKLKVYTANAKGSDSWSKLEGLPFNSDEYSVAHPALTPDGNILYFSSDMPGGFGGMDLYMSEKESGNWGPPLNLGPSINTEGNEVFPYYHKDKRLYFSSDGQIGLGGLDIYYMEDKGDSEWGPIENIGYPINSISDDFGVIFNEEGTCGHFSSDREGGAGRDDIYSFKKIASPVEILVFDKETKEPIEGAEVVDDCTGETLTTDAEGKVRVDMRMDECCTFAASMETYMNNEEEGCTKDIKMGEPVFVEIPLEKEMGFELEGIVFDQSTGLPLEGAVVTLTNDCEEEEQTLTTDATGTFSFKLEKDCCYTINGTKKNYFGSPVKDQCTRGLEEATTLQANLNLQPISVTDTPPTPGDPDGPQILNGEKDPCANVYKDVNRGIYIDGATGEPYTGDCGGITYVKGIPGNVVNPVFPVSPTEYNKESGETSIAYLLHIYYDFNQSYIRDEGESELQKLYDMMVANPDYVVELSSHTDSRGSNSYNRTLSQRRAESAVRWLIDKGINEDRLIPRGYGERKNVNGCANNIPCSEQEHQLNRRTEFRIVGCLGDEKVKTLSQPNPSPRLDACQGCPF